MDLCQEDIVTGWIKRKRNEVEITKIKSLGISIKQMRSHMELRQEGIVHPDTEPLNA